VFEVLVGVAGWPATCQGPIGSGGPWFSWPGGAMLRAVNPQSRTRDPIGLARARSNAMFPTIELVGESDVALVPRSDDDPELTTGW
jgi:hypothetical protein